MKSAALSTAVNSLRETYGERLQENVRMANFTTARVGGPADALLAVHSADELAAVAQSLWQMDAPFIVVGSGSNLLVSDQGYHGIVLLNQARNARFDDSGENPTVWVESGDNFSSLARQAGLRGFSGLEWASTIPGTVGGAVYGNAGAFGGNTAGILLLADILHRSQGREQWGVERMDYQYRSSALKRHPGDQIILAAMFWLTRKTPDAVKTKMDEFSARRRSTQPPGACLGSMFKNPPNDYAGRLIEAAGLKGTRIGGAEISPVHANFFINVAEATASDYDQLIRLAQTRVAEQFGVQLQLEVELLGDFSAEPSK